MRKPVPRTEPLPLTAEVPKTRKRKRTNPADAGNGIGAETTRPKPRRPAASPARKLTPTVIPSKATASKQLLTLLGHNESCASLRRAGSIVSCDCRIKAMEDPAITVGLAIHFARISLAQRAPLPTVIIELLARRVEEGDPACVMVAEWLETCGLLDLKPLSRSKRRLG